MEVIEETPYRLGATRALPPGHPDLPLELREVGQPVLIPGSMATASYVLRGVAGGGAFFSTCHCAGRVQSRNQAARAIGGAELRRRLERQGIAVRSSSARGLAEEAPAAYKDVSAVIEAAQGRRGRRGTRRGDLRPGHPGRRAARRLTRRARGH